MESELKRSSADGLYKRFNVILGWKMNTGKAFSTILHRYVRSPGVIVDLTAGDRLLYRHFNDGNSLGGRRYTLICGDIREVEGNQYTCDILDPPPELYGVADGFVFDPPWPARSKSLGDMLVKYHPMTSKEFALFLPEALQQIKRIVKPGGVLIVKISHPWNHIIYNYLDDMRWVRDIIQISINQGVYLTSYFMIFRKKRLGTTK